MLRGRRGVETGREILVNSSHESLPGEVGCCCSWKLGGAKTLTARMATDAEQEEYSMVWRRMIRTRNFFTRRTLDHTLSSPKILK